jgi:hypothetical protein
MTAVSKPKWNAEKITDLSVVVYKIRLEDATGGGEGAVARMLAKDGDGGKKLRGRAEAYDPLSKAYVVALGLQKDYQL